MLYVRGRRPYTVNNMPDDTLEAFYDHGEVDALLGRFARAGVDTGEVAAKLQGDGAESFVTAWNELLDRIAARTAAGR